MISIIIPIYNVEAYIEECLGSILNQSFSDYEVLCINDGSTDNSASICQQFVDVDERFYLINKENGGVCSARNVGLDKARGDLICFVDSDDKIDRNYLCRLLALYKQNTLPICSFSSNENNLGQGNKIKQYESANYIKHIFNEDIQHPNLWAMLFDHRIIEKNNLRFVNGCIINEDTEFFVKYMVHCKRIVVSNYKGYFYRINPNSVMHSGLNMKSLTSIDAQARMADYLVKHGIYTENNSILSNAVQVNVFYAAKSKNREIYKYLHAKYSVRNHMCKMLYHPRLGRRMVSALYLLLGYTLFYKILSLVSR